MTHTKTQMWCAWSGIVGTLFFASALIIPGFLPPPGPSLSQAEVVAMYQQNATGIRIGMVLMMISGMFIAPFVAAISVQLKRIEGERTPILTYTQLSTGTVGILFYVIPGVIFLITAYRPERSPELTYLMNDFSWIITVMVWPPYFMQNLAVASLILKDTRAQPIFPRWVAFFSYWVCLLYVPGSLIPFFKSGPFAWNGLLGFWAPGSMFFIWILVMAVMLLKAIKRQAVEEAQHNGSNVQTREMHEHTFSASVRA